MELTVDARKELRKAAAQLGRKHFDLMVESTDDKMELCVVKRQENTPIVRVGQVSTTSELNELTGEVAKFVAHIWNRREIWELPLGDPDDPINIDKVRSPVQLLMNMDEMSARIEYGCPEGYGQERYCDQFMAHDDGFYSAFKYALIHPQDEIEHVVEHGTGYVSYGDDTLDLFESGYDAGIAWAAGRFEWDAEGNVLEGSIKA